MYGLKYVINVSFPPKMPYSYLEQLGDLKWHTHRVKEMRKNFKNFFQASIVTYTFMFL